MKSSQLWGLLSVCCIMFGFVLGIEPAANIREEDKDGVASEKESFVIIVDEEKNLIEEPFEPYEIDMKGFFGEVEEVNTVRRIESAPLPYWKEKLIPVFLWLALWYELAEKKARRMVFCGCKAAEWALGCER